MTCYNQQMSGKKTTSPKRTPTQATEMLDPDVRFLLANERTLLAWVRTGLALIAGGLALTQLGNNPFTRFGLGALAVIIGALMAVNGYIRYLTADKAIREARLPAAGHGPLLQVIAVIALALAIVIIECSYFYLSS